MTIVRLAVIAALSACMGGDDTGIDDRTVGADERADVDRVVKEPSEPDVCSLLPDCGPCSLACDLDALEQEYVPPGTCVAFACTLKDGRQVAVHACHP